MCLMQLAVAENFAKTGVTLTPESSVASRLTLAVGSVIDDNELGSVQVWRALSFEEIAALEQIRHAEQSK